MSDANPKCGAKTRRGKPCAFPAGHGTDHVGVGRCRRHGGASPQAQVAGVVELAKREAAVMGQPLDISPGDALLQCIQIAAGEVQFASEQIARLEAGEAVGPVVTTSRGSSKDRGKFAEIHEGAPALHIWIRVRQQAMDRLVNYSSVAIKAGLEERRVKIAEQTGQLIASAVRGILEELGVADRPETPGVVRRHLTLVAGGADASRAA